MKFSFIFCAMASGLFAAPPMVDSLSSEEFAAKQLANPVATIAPVKAGEPAPVRPKEQSIIRESAILHDGVHWSLVPKGAVLHMPEAMKARVNAKPVGMLLTWSEFLSRNSNWISVAEVTFDQASGKTPLPEVKTKFWASQSKVIVAVHQGGPISVLPSPQSTTITQR